MKNIVRLIFLIPFSFVVFAAENPEQSPFVTRGKNLGDTGATRAQRANSLQRSETIKLNLPRKTSSEEKQRKFYKSPRSQGDIAKERGASAVLPEQPFDFSKPAAPRINPSYDPFGVFTEKK